MLNLLNSTYLIFIGLALACYYCIQAYSYWKKRGVPSITAIPPFGNFSGVLQFKSNIMVSISGLYNKFEGERLAGLYRFFTPCLMIRDPELIKEVMLKDFQNFQGRGFNVNIFNPLLENLIFQSGSKWRNLRTRLTPTFTSEKMKMMFPILATTGEELKKFLEEPAANGDVVEIEDIMARYTTDVIASCAFGIQCNCLKNPNAEFREWGRKVLSPSIKTFMRAITLFFPFLNRYLRSGFIPKDVNDYFIEMVRETVNYREKNNVQRNDFMQLLIQMKNRKLGLMEGDELAKVQNVVEHDQHNNPPFEVTMELMAAQAFGFFVAGYETSSTTLTFCLYELAVNPDIQVKVRKEVDDVFEKHNGQFEYDGLLQMEYLDKVINETLRKYPPLPLLTRECTNTTCIQGTDVIVEKGTQIFLPVYALQNDPKYFPEPNRFDPERFSPEEKQRRHHYCYLPFGEGPRQCIGMKFGLMETKVGIINVLSEFEVHVSEKTPLSLEFDPKSLIPSPKGGMWLKITKRKQ